MPFLYPVNRLSTVIHIRIRIPESIPTVHIGWIEVLFTAVGRIDFRKKWQDSRRETNKQNFSARDGLSTESVS